MAINKVTVIIAAYNQAEYLPETLASVAANCADLQSNNPLAEVELLVVDDGSTDATHEVVTGFSNGCPQNCHARYVYQENQGQAAAYENVLPLISGDIVCLLDSDDRFLPHKIGRVLDIFNQHPEAGMVAHCLYVIDSGGLRTGEVKPEGSVISHGDIRQVVRQSGRLVYPPSSGLSFRTELFREIHPSPLKVFASAADGYLSYAAAVARPVCGCPEALGEYRRHGESHFYRRMISLSGLQKQIAIQQKIMDSLSLSDVLENNSFFARNIFACDRMTAGVSVWTSALRRLNRAIFNDPYTSLKRKTVMACFWDLAAMLPRPLFWRCWVFFQRISTGMQAQGE
jgi:glycosyltransferase involved in cell wall biosynthesis